MRERIVREARSKVSLNNFEIRLEISVNETMEKKYAYSTEEKFAKLLEKNKALETLKQTFNLDV